MYPIYLISNTSPNDKAVIHLPMLGTSWLTPAIDFSRYDGIILTSKNGAEAMERIDAAWKTLPVICVGSATKKTAAAYGADVIETGNGYGDAIYDLIRERYAHLRWLYARPKVVASDFAERLRKAGTAIDEAVVYETVCNAEAPQPELPEEAVLIFTSPSALRCFEQRYRLLPTHTLVVIGTTTQKAADGHRVHVAPEPTVDACVTLAKQLAKDQP